MSGLSVLPCDQTTGRARALGASSPDRRAVEALLEKGATPVGRVEIAEASGIGHA